MNVYTDADLYYLAHHGIEGQKWGVTNGPPYPLDSEAHSAAERRAGTSGWSEEAQRDLKNANRYARLTKRSRDTKLKDMVNTKAEKKGRKTITGKVLGTWFGSTFATSLIGSIIGINTGDQKLVDNTTNLLTALNTAGTLAVGVITHNQIADGRDSINNLVKQGYGEMTMEKLNEEMARAMRG